MPSPERLRANVARIQVMSFTWMFMVIMPVVVPFLALHGQGIDRVYQLQAIFAVALVVLEVPSGYASDLLGRKGCLVAAGFLHGAAFTVLAGATTFSGFALFELLAAVAVSLYSGTDVALLYDSLEAQGDLAGRKRALGRRLMWMQGGETAAALLAAGLLSGVFGAATLDTVALVNAAVGWTPFVVALGLVEVPRARLDRTTHLENARLILRGIFVHSPVRRMLMLNLVTYGLATLIAVWAFQGYWEELGIGLASFGLLWAAYNLTVAIVGRVAHQIEERLGGRPTVRLVGLLPVVGYGGMALCAYVADTGIVPLVLGVAFGFAFQVGRGLTQVVIKDALNSCVPTEWRATANSISSMGVRLSFFVLGPLLGWLIEAHGWTVALTAFAGLFVLLLGTINRSLAKAVGDAPSLGYHAAQEEG